MTVGELYCLIDRIAPFETQADFDNSGLLVGSPGQEVTCILLALDVTEAVIDEAVALGAELIVSHHPLMFSPRKRLTDEDREGRLLRRLVRENLSLIAAHTNLDQAAGGMNDTLAELCGLTGVTGERFFRYGDLPHPLAAADYAEELSCRLGDSVRLLGPADARITRVGLCSGGGGDEWVRAAETGCDAFVTGEIRHHQALALTDLGVAAFECGHFATEAPGIAALGAALQNAFREVEYNVRVSVSEASTYGFPPRP